MDVNNKATRLSITTIQPAYGTPSILQHSLILQVKYGRGTINFNSNNNNNHAGCCLSSQMHSSSISLSFQNILQKPIQTLCNFAEIPLTPNKGNQNFMNSFLPFAAHKKGRQEFFEIKELLPTIISFPYIPLILHAPNLA